MALLSVLLIAFIAVYCFTGDSSFVSLFTGSEVNPDALLLATGPAFAPLKWPTGQNNMGGFKPFVLFIPHDACKTVPALPEASAATDNNDFVTAKGTFTFNEPGLKNPLYLYSTDGEVGYSAESQGETDGKSFVQKLEFFFPGNLPEMHAFNALVKNTPGYYVFEDSDGRQMIMGAEGLPTATTPSYNGGKKRADRRGTAYSVTCDSNFSGIYLAEKIDINAILNPSPEAA